MTPGRLPRRSATRSGRPGGPAQATLRAVRVRTAATMRAVGALAAVAQAVIWRGFYLGAPERLVWPAAAVAWTAALLLWLRRADPGWRLAAADATVTVAIALAGVGSVPPALRGDTASWRFLIVVCQIPTPVWLAPRRVGPPLALAVVAAWSVGAWVSARGRSVPADVVLLAVVGVSWVGLRTLSRRAAGVDAALAQADRQAREQHIERSRNAERREHERLMHDTVLNTLTALARGGADRGQVAARSRHDLALMESALSGRGDPSGPAQGGLTARIGVVAQELRERGLAVHVVADEGAPSLDGKPAVAAGAVVPGQVAAAFADAAREALSNVASHAGTGVAWVDVRSGPPAACPQAPAAAVRVTVRDEGAGFDPAAVVVARLGLRRSIVGRVADCGGASSIVSAPGAGTVVTLWWPAGPVTGGAGSRW